MSLNEPKSHDGPDIVLLHDYVCKHRNNNKFLAGTSVKGNSFKTYTINITKTYLYNFEPLKSHFYLVKLGFTGVYSIFLISAQK